MHIEPYEGAQSGWMIQNIAAAVMNITAATSENVGGREVLRLRGSLRIGPDEAYAYLAPRLQAMGLIAILREEREGVSLLVAPGNFVVARSRLWVALLLFCLTVISTIVIGGLTGEGFRLGLGLAYSAALLSILLAHELGHFLVARRLGVNVSYPFFIPVPLPPLGTMGAFIAMKEPPPDRRALLKIAIAGPLAGLIVAIPVLALGLSLSELPPPVAVPEGGGVTVGNSLLYAAIKIAVFGEFVPNSDVGLVLHPVAFAGWAGLLVTGLNLIPAGQLDGGHIFYALFGPRIARIGTWVIAAILISLGWLWGGWYLWAFLILILGRQHAPLLNELTPLDFRLKLLAIFGLLVFVLVFTPAPLAVVLP
ncbi:MAG: site-2 protease family protein [Chloroflexales bacterium]|nr:site-2 protease family protein [Chloroflexales bacterium]